MATFNGNKRNNHLTGTADPDGIDGRGGNDLLKGLGGADFIFGNTGNDVIEGGADGDNLDGFTGIDTLSYAGSPSGVIIALGADGSIAATVSGGDAAGDTCFAFENITGSAFDDNLTGNDFANVLKGGAGVDYLDGRGGKDTLLGGAGRDSFNGGAGADILNGGADVDRAQYFNSTSGVTVTLGKNGAETIGKGGEAQGDRISKVEDVSGSSFTDILIGNNLANVLYGGLGDTGDTLRGRGGGDVLSGGGGADFIVGGKGNDELNGGASNDAFVFGRGFGHDTIDDLEEGAGLGDIIDLHKDVFKNFAALLAASAQVGADVVITKDADNTITLKDVLLANLNADDFVFF